MPNRILKESICASENIDGLSAFQETFFYRLIVCCDDYGRMDARPTILASRLYPLRREIKTAQIIGALNALASADLITLYEVNGKPYLQMNTWERHQTIRAKKPKYPAPEDGVKADENICIQMISNESKCSRNPIQSNTNPIQSEYELRFTEFYQEYPRKIDPKRAKAAWDKLKVDESLFAAIMDGLRKWKRAWDDPKFVPYPATWLNNRRWESEPPKGKRNAALNYEQAAISKSDFDALVVDLGGET